MLGCVKSQEPRAHLPNITRRSTWNVRTVQKITDPVVSGKPLEINAALVGPTVLPFGKGELVGVLRQAMTVPGSPFALTRRESRAS